MKAGAAGCRPVTGKNANMDVCVFSYFSAHSYGCGLSLLL